MISHLALATYRQGNALRHEACSSGSKISGPILLRARGNHLMDDLGSRSDFAVVVEMKAAGFLEAPIRPKHLQAPSHPELLRFSE